MDISGKVGLITGGADGIGKVLVENLLKKGAKVCRAVIGTYSYVQAFSTQQQNLLESIQGTCRISLKMDRGDKQKPLMDCIRR